jgi:AAT family amino acid transporter
VALLAVANWLNHRKRDARPGVESSDGEKQRVLID